MGQLHFPIFDYHIANSPYTAQEFYESVDKSNNPKRSDKFFNWCWRVFKAPRVPFEGTHRRLSARRQRRAIFTGEKIRNSKAGDERTRRIPKTRRFCFTPENFA
jgi:hypothetical protein